MTKAAPPPSSLEDISAALLSGVMLTVLSSAFAGALAWQLIADLTGWLPSLKAMLADLPSKAPHAGGEHVLTFGLLLASCDFVGRGLRHVRENLAKLRARRT